MCLTKRIFCVCAIIFFVAISCSVWAQDTQIKSVLGSGRGELDFNWPFVLGRGFNLSIDFDQIIFTTTIAISGTDVRESFQVNSGEIKGGPFSLTLLPGQYILTETYDGRVKSSNQFLGQPSVDLTPIVFTRNLKVEALTVCTVSIDTRIYDFRAEVSGDFITAPPIHIPETIGAKVTVKLVSTRRFNGGNADEKIRYNAEFKAKISSETKIEPVGIVIVGPVNKGTSVITFTNENSAALGSELELVGNLKPQLAEQTISLEIIKPDGSIPTPTNIQTGELGIFTHREKLNLSGNWEFTATWAGNDNYESVTKTLSVSVSSEVGKAILVLGGGDRQNNKDWRTFSSVAQYVYKVFQKRQFDAEDDIYYLSPEPTQTKGADGQTSLGTLELAITNWAKKQVNPQVPLYIYLLSHNLGDKFLLEKSGNQEKYLSPQLLDIWLDTLPEGTPVTVVIEACYSGNFISRNGTPTALVGENRTIIVSARGDRQSKIARSSSFSRTFFSYIESNKPVGEAFNQTVRRMEKMQYHRGQHPEMDSNGDGSVNQPEDYALLRERYLPADLISLANSPELTKITEATTLKKGISSLRIEVELVGTNITHIYATVVPPTYDPTTEIASWSELEFDEFDLGKVSEGKYAATYANFTLAGDYAVIVNAENADGFANPVQTIITVAGEESTKPKLAGDVNGDNSVNIFDLVMVAGQFGKSGAGLSGDVNGDSSVNIFDLVMVAGNFGKSNVAAAPTVLANKLTFTTQQKWSIQSAIVELKDMSARSQAEELVLNLLIAILPERLPEQTQLLPNYPNPFNPETWIPFELSQDSKVSITIYDIAGTPVRNISMGYLQAGSYVSQSKAAYWDGKTDTGERVASGTYFYTLKTAGYVSTQKMIILK